MSWFERRLGLCLLGVLLGLWCDLLGGVFTCGGVLVGDTAVWLVTVVLLTASGLLIVLFILCYDLCYLIWWLLLVACLA